MQGYIIAGRKSSGQIWSVCALVFTGPSRKRRNSKPQNEEEEEKGVKRSKMRDQAAKIRPRKLFKSCETKKMHICV